MDYLQLSAETVNEVVPAAVHAVEDEEDVEDDHLDDHMDDHLDDQVAVEVNFKEDVRYERTSRLSIMIITKIKIIRTSRLSMISKQEVSWRNLTHPRFRSVTCRKEKSSKVIIGLIYLFVEQKPNVSP